MANLGWQSKTNSVQNIQSVALDCIFATRRGKIDFLALFFPLPLPTSLLKTTSNIILLVVKLHKLINTNKIDICTVWVMIYNKTITFWYEKYKIV